MSTIPSIDPAVPPLGKRGAFEGVARRHGRRRNPARMTPRSSLRTPTNPALHSPQRWVEKGAYKGRNAETRPVAGAAAQRDRDEQQNGGDRTGAEARGEQREPDREDTGCAGRGGAPNATMLLPPRIVHDLDLRFAGEHSCTEPVR